MKIIYKTSIFVLLLSLFLISCSTKNESYVATSQNEDISELLQKVINKEKEINELKKQLEQCQSKNTK